MMGEQSAYGQTETLSIAWASYALGLFGLFPAVASGDPPIDGNQRERATATAVFGFMLAYAVTSVSC